MAKTTHSAISYRLFATLLMFLTFVLGGLIGYSTGFGAGEQNAIALLYEGKQAEEVTVETDQTRTQSAAARTACYQEALGESRYEALMAGEAEVSATEVFQLLACSH